MKPESPLFELDAPCLRSTESDLEDQLLDKLQEFLLEMGHGFCFEARQKRILIGDTHYFVDLIFYHRILKCHVLVELKVDEFTHEHIGQLNTTNSLSPNTSSNCPKKRRCSGFWPSR